MTNKEFMKDKDFISACDNAGVAITKRQASKFRNKRGKAWKKFSGRV